MCLFSFTVSLTLVWPRDIIISERYRRHQVRRPKRYGNTICQLRFFSRFFFDIFFFNYYSLSIYRFIHLLQQCLSPFRSRSHYSERSKGSADQKVLSIFPGLRSDRLKIMESFLQITQPLQDKHIFVNQINEIRVAQKAVDNSFKACDLSTLKAKLFFHGDERKNEVKSSQSTSSEPIMVILFCVRTMKLFC